jgi:hypothetical protein
MKVIKPISMNKQRRWGLLLVRQWALAYGRVSIRLINMHVLEEMFVSNSRER